MSISSHPHESGNISNMTAIVIDDDKDTASVLSDFLQIKGVRVLGKGYDGNEATELYKELVPDIVFLDIMMEKYDGFYALGKIREINHNAFIIAVTADITQETHDRLEASDISAIIYKPYNINEIMHILERVPTIRLSHK